MRVGRLVAFTPYSVISGFMSGIGVIIMLLQTLPFLGAVAASGGPLGALQALPDAITGVNYNAVIIAAVTPGRGRAMAGQIAQVAAAHPGGPDCRHATGRPLADRCPDNRRRAYRPARTEAARIFPPVCWKAP